MSHVVLIHRVYNQVALLKVVMLVLDRETLKLSSA